MKTCFGFMFWGVLLVALGFNFNDFNVLPYGVRSVGYALVAIGAGGLAGLTGNFIVATSLGWLLVVGSVVGSYFPGDVETPFGIFMTVLDCAMMWTMLGGIIDVATGRHRMDLAKRAAYFRSAYVALIAVVMLLGRTVHGSGGLNAMVAAVLFVTMLIVMLLILHLIYRMRKVFSR